MLARPLDTGNCRLTYKLYTLLRAKGHFHNVCMRLVLTNPPTSHHLRIAKGHEALSAVMATQSKGKLPAQVWRYWAWKLFMPGSCISSEKYEHVDYIILPSIEWILTYHMPKFECLRNKTLLCYISYVYRASSVSEKLSLKRNTHCHDPKGCWIFPHYSFPIWQLCASRVIYFSNQPK